jgi:RNA polymerase sigma factor (sigma-70 family)
MPFAPVLPLMRRRARRTVLRLSPLRSPEGRMQDAIEILHYAEPPGPPPMGMETPGACPASSDDPSDHDLVQACLCGDQHAWGVLIRRYKDLIYSFPRRYGASPADASDVFQLVCTELYRALPQVRNHQTLRAWIMTVAAHQAYHWKRRYVLRAQRENCDGTAVDAAACEPSHGFEQSEEARVVRSAIAQLPPRCRELVRLLFYQDPPQPYQLVAGQLGLATGSIGLTRSRCLKRLEKILEQSGMHKNV